MSAVRADIDRIRPRVTVDPLFQADVVDGLPPPDIRSIIEDGSRVMPVTDRRSIGWRRHEVSLRHRAFRPSPSTP